MNLIEIKPSTISIITTYQCTASCRNCCFGCNSKLSKKITLEEVKRYIEDILAIYEDTIKVVVLTGGETFLLKDDLLPMVKYISEKKLITRIVSNAYWATSYEKAMETLQPLVIAGLKEINFSTGDDHQNYVDYDNIVFASMAAMSLDITCVINVESHDRASFTASKMFKDARLRKFFELEEGRNNTLQVKSSAWMPVVKNNNISYHNVNISDDSKKRCTSIFNNVSINPYSNLLACCGLCVEKYHI